MPTTTITAERNNLNERTQFVSFTGDGNDIAINVGFVPTVVKVYNDDDAIAFEKTRGMAAANSIKYTAGAGVTKDTSSAVVIAADGGITIAAAAAPNTKKMSVLIVG